MDYQAGTSEHGPLISGSDSLIYVPRSLRAALTGAPRPDANAGKDGPAVPVMAGEVFGGIATERLMTRVRGWGRTRLGAGHLTSPRLLFAAGRGPIYFQPEGSKARWHYVVSFGEEPCTMRVRDCTLSLASLQLAVYSAASTAQFDFAPRDSHYAGVLVDGLLW